MAAPRAFLHLGAREWHGRARGTHSMSGLATPDSNREKKRTLLQFLSDHFHDVQTLREYLLQKQISKVSMENRSYRKIQERYGPYITGAQFILKQGGAVKNLRRLDISDLPAVSHPGLTQILVEEMLPHCEVLGVDWAKSLKLGPDDQPPDTSSPLSS